MYQKSVLLIFSIVLICALSACAKKPKQDPTPPKPIAVIADEAHFPQDLTFYAKRVGNSKKLLSPEQQTAAKQRFDRIYYGPWKLTHGTVNKADACVRKARGYKINGMRWTQAEWDTIVANANLATFPSLGMTAITIRNTDLREIPTHDPRYDKTGIVPQKYPFDEFQYSQLPIGMPLFLSHRSADGRWFFAECPLVGGWIDANDVAFTDDNFNSMWQSYPLAAIIKDQLPLPQVGTPATIGTVLPLVSRRGKNFEVMLPKKDANNYATYEKITLTREQVQPHPLVLTPANMAMLANQMMGQHYGWGGMYGLRDCSATTHDLLAPFGVWLPRNSRPQARTGAVINLESMTADEKEETIKRHGVPFLSLVGLPGHITMYVGTYKDQVAILHNTWGVRTVDGEDTNARHVIGKTLVTSIKPGNELPDLFRERTFVDRIRALATPGY